MAMSMQARRGEMKSAVERLVDAVGIPARAWLASMDDPQASEETRKDSDSRVREDRGEQRGRSVRLDNQDMLIKPSMWIFGGDGWAYDIGYGGLDHVWPPAKTSMSWSLIQKYTPTQAVSPPRLRRSAQSQNSRLPVRQSRKKDLAQIGDGLRLCLYVAQVAMGADEPGTDTSEQFCEAESYHGPS